MYLAYSLDPYRYNHTRVTERGINGNEVLYTALNYRRGTYLVYLEYIFVGGILPICNSKTCRKGLATNGESILKYPTVSFHRCNQR